MLIFLHRPGQGVLGEVNQAGAGAHEDLCFLAPETFEARRENGRLQWRGPGAEDWADVKLVRMFPHSDPQDWISVVTPEGKELGVLRNLGAMDREARELVLGELDRRYLTSRIVRLVSSKRRFDVLRWTVETTRGPTTFLTRGLRDQLQQPLPGHIIFSDVEGNRYEIPDVAALDPASRRLLEEQM